ncbi:hypothetical protein [Streptomyces sp. XD-27]|uniref:hypothetical protein n=1 Tax=Streptomyces sp. XD-27 TaxID=3062779 RepID=UPI0026F40BCE|nr:hypothetical protein [Streptomyces sp. XD-27]WKX74574.1 hypothetical protein Q3Y56_01895 [Streptomyces sp. XD-27]
MTGPGTRDCIGLLINTHALRQRLPAAAPLRDLPHTTAERPAGAVQNQVSASVGGLMSWARSWSPPR